MPAPSGSLTFPGTDELLTIAGFGAVHVNVIATLTITELAWVEIDWQGDLTLPVIVLHVASTNGIAVGPQDGVLPSVGVYYSPLQGDPTVDNTGVWKIVAADIGGSPAYDGGLSGTGTYKAHYAGGTDVHSLTFPGTSDSSDGHNKNALASIPSFKGGVFITLTSNIGTSPPDADVTNDSQLGIISTDAIGGATLAGDRLAAWGSPPYHAADSPFVVVTQPFDGPAIVADWWLYVYNVILGDYDPALTGAGTYDLSTADDAPPPPGLTQPAASFSGTQTRDTVVPTGNPSYPWNLFRGQVIRPDVERIGNILKVTLACSDYNRLWSATKLGAPSIGVFREDPDGTIVAIDPRALLYGDGAGDGGVFRFHVEFYWPGGPPGLSLRVHNTNPDYNGLPVMDWSTAYSDLGAFLTEFASRQSGATRFWVDPDYEGNYTTVGPNPTEEDFRVPAPFEIDMDGPIQSGNVIQAMSLTATPDNSNLRRRVFVRGGTPVSSQWVDNPDDDVPLRAGEEYVDAPGAVDADAGLRIGLWWLRWTYRTLITGNAHINGPGPEEGGHDGWRIGQSGVFSDDTLSRFEGLPLDRYEAIITSVTGKLVAPGPGLIVAINDVDITAKVTKYESLTFTEKGFGEVGTATLVMEIVDEDETLVIPELADIRIATDGSAALEYDLEWGDIAGGGLAEQLAKLALPTTVGAPQPAYKVLFSSDQTLISILKWADVVGQLADGSDAPVKLAGVFVSVELFQWTDLAETTPGTGFTIQDSGTDLSSYTTDSNGRIFFRVLRDDVGDAKVFYPKGQALPL